MTSSQLLDAACRRRSPATMPDFHRGRPPRNKGLQYPADPPTVEEIVAVMRSAGDRPYGLRTRALIVLLWRSGLRITEALSLAESDLDSLRGSVPCARREGRQATRGWDGPLGVAAPRRVDPAASRCGSARCCASSKAPTKAGRGRQPLQGQRCGSSPSRLVFAVGSPRTSSDMGTPVRWPAKAFPKESTAAKSSTPSTAARHRCSQRAPDSGDGRRPVGRSEEWWPYNFRRVLRRSSAARRPMGLLAGSA
jgi:hypothetical protein